MILKEFAATIGPGVEGKTFDTPFAALEWIERNPVALILVDYRMPGMDGIEFTRRLRQLRSGQDVPVVMITAVADTDKAIRYEALKLGILDFLPKPIDHEEWRSRCWNILRYCGDRAQSQCCSEMSGLLLRVAQSVNGRDPQRLAYISHHIARRIGMPSDVCRLIQQAAPLADLGLLWVPGGLLSKPEPLLPEEHRVIQGHTITGFQLLQQGDSEVSQLASKISLSHHEHFDGTGYPHGFSGRDLPLAARAVAVADRVDALLSDRAYRKAWPIDRTLEYVRAKRGTIFDPDCVDAFFQEWDERLLAGGGEGN